MIKKILISGFVIIVVVFIIGYAMINEIFHIPDSKIETTWTYLADTTGGCLVGGQYCHDGKCRGQACCLDNRMWQVLFEFDKKELSYFLVEQLNDTATSKVHTCPYFNASKGELATYCLHRIYKINWYDLDSSYYKYIDGSLEQSKDYYSLQEVLQGLLENEVEVENMKRKWTELINEP